MGSHSGGGYAAPPSGVEVLMDNIDRLAKRFPMATGGRFGRKGKNARVVESDDPAGTARDFWNALSKGGRPAPLPDGRGDRVYFEDGSRVIHRPISSDGSPAIEIIIATPVHGVAPEQKIHFVTRGWKK
jgi:hypothetical protein